jgi:hypothetical protein
MKPLLLLLAVSFGHPAAAQTNEHPIIHQLATAADVIAVARLREPQLWRSSELIVMTGLSTALIDRTLKGEVQPPKIMIQVVRHLDIEHMEPELPNAPSPNGGLKFPVTPAIPSKPTNVHDTTGLESADKVIVFLRRSKEGTLSAVDGFLYTLPYSLELEGAVSSAVRTQAQQDAAAQPATRPLSK